MSGLQGASYGRHEGRKRGDIYISDCDVWRVISSDKRKDWQQAVLIARFRSAKDARAFVRMKKP